MFFCFIVLPQHFELYFVIVVAPITAFQSIKTHSNVSWLANVNSESCFFMSLVCKYIFVKYDSVNYVISDAVSDHLFKFKGRFLTTS